LLGIIHDVKTVIVLWLQREWSENGQAV